MREQIKKLRNGATDEVISLICEEIRKVENPYVTEGRRWQQEIVAWNVCRQQILALLKEWGLDA